MKVIIFFLLTLSVNCFSQTVISNLGLPIYDQAGNIIGKDSIKRTQINFLENGENVFTRVDSLISRTGRSIPTSDEFNLVSTPTNASAATKLRLFAYEKTPLVGSVSNAGNSNYLAPFEGNINICRWSANGNSTALLAPIGMPAYTVVGTATARTVATTNNFTMQKRLAYVSAATAGSLASIRSVAAQYTLGNTLAGVKTGGFLNIIRFGISDAATVATARMFVGMSNITTVPTNVEPSTLNNLIGIGHGAADANLKIFYGGSAAQTPIDLGVNFPKTGGSGFELWLYNPNGNANTVYYIVKNINTGVTTFGTLTGTAGTVLPLNTTLLTPMRSWRTNNTTALAVGIDLISQYIITNY
jgi:hypothetical protein